MAMRIRDDIRLGTLQEEFRRQFPFLKIEFYAESHRMGMGSPERARLSPDLLIGEVRQNNTTGHFCLDDQQRTADFEEMLSAVYGLHVQVFRRSRGRWLQTWATDSWTLGEQNKRGEVMARPSFGSSRTSPNQMTPEES